MIAYDLMCANGHTFEGWFDNLESFERQDSENLIGCPLCESTEIKRIFSPVAMKSASKSSGLREDMPVDYHRLAVEMINYIQNEFEDIGSEFTKEALKIHYGASEARNIRGTATEDEEKILEKEGVPFVKFPAANKNNNKN